MFWDNFMKLCIDRSTTPNAVCSKLGFSNATATHWKNGTIPNGDAILKLSDYFNVSTDYLLGRTQDPNEQIAEAALAPDEQTLVTDYRTLTPPGQEYIRDTMDFAKK